jgi:acyl carrier protein
MTREEIKTIVFNKFNEDYSIDLSTLEGNFPLAELQSLNKKLDSLEVIAITFELEELLNIESITIEKSVTTIDELIDSLYFYQSIA